MSRHVLLIAGVVALFWVLPACADPILVRGQRQPTALDHLGQDIQIQSAHASAASSANAFTALPGARICLNDPACTVYAVYTSGSVTIVGAPLDVTSVGIVNLQGLVQAAMLGESLSISSLLLTKNESGADTLTLLGGRLRLAPVEVNANAWIDFDSATGFRVGNQLNMADGAFLTVDNLSPKRSTETLSLYGAHGATLVPQSAVDSCASGRKGQVTSLSSDGEWYECDGSINARFQRTLWSAVTNIDIGNLASHTSETHTVTVTGATTADQPLCRPLTSPTADIDAHEYISAADTVSIIFHNDSGGNVDPAATDWQCLVFVK